MKICDQLSLQLVRICIKNQPAQRLGNSHIILCCTSTYGRTQNYTEPNYRIR